MPDESLVLTETVSYNVFKFTTSTENVIKIAGTDPYFHMFSGRYENNCSITLNLTASDHEMFTAKITTSGNGNLLFLYIHFFEGLLLSKVFSSINLNAI